jgi:hypothetical protein
MSTLSISLPDETLQFLEAEARRQNAGSASAFASVLLREAQMAQRVEDQLLAGLASGPGSPFDDQWAARMKERVLGTSCA